MEYQFTQAELTNAVTEQVFIDIGIEIGHRTVSGWGSVTEDMFDQHFRLAIDKHLATKRAIQAFRFNSDVGDTECATKVCDAPSDVPSYGAPTEDYQNQSMTGYAKTERRNELLRGTENPKGSM